MDLCKFELYQVNINCSNCCLFGPVRTTWVCASFNSIKSSSAAVLDASLDWLTLHGSLQVSTLSSHHQLQYLLPHFRPVRATWICASLNSIKSSSVAVLAASLDQLGLHGSVQVSTLSSHHQLQYLFPLWTS